MKEALKKRNLHTRFPGKRFSFLLFIFFLLAPASSLFSQANDSIRLNNNNVSRNSFEPDSAYRSTDSTKIDSALALKKSKRHSPLKAALFSAVLPGLGQAYNKRYWKIPIVYAGFGGLAYAIYYTATNFNGFRTAYRAQLANPVSTNYASYDGVTDPSTLKDYRDYFKKYLDISAIGTGAWYLLTIVDAAVDAHLTEWNMKDDLSIAWQPVVMTSNYGTLAMGVRVKITFR
jgi:hypothetical protein